MCAITMKRTHEAGEQQQEQPRPRKVQRILMSSLPDRMRAAATKETVSPQTVVLKTLAEDEHSVTVQSFSALENFFHPPTEEEIAAYDHEAIAAIRTQNMDTLKQYHAEGRPLKCSNKFGESLLHMACRKGMLQVTTFLTQTANVPFQVCDDYGRSPLHDACWAHTTNFELVDLILTECPDLLYIQDKRGNTPLSYLKQEKWAAWNKYLASKSADFLKPRFSSQLLA
ncbi:Ankyrin repeat-containing protein [Seminavis robusta]|uniref:Ankyrin repeat-containing protein n=1 Tax=Seminavis robusta TaxID=568900 RepID=A0A9N8HE09_9STRA|nr:Ankyrin repeat-containing protein [Seminavis robusta]|eukprot:Sro280_g107150.1 Ankyrin repeat-containing protein (227) ;mRNA; r:79297-79977